MSTPAFIRAQSDGVLISIRLQPRASANQITGAVGNELKIKVTAAPVDRAANDALLSLLAGVFDCARNRIELVRGHTSRHKLVKLFGVSAQQAASLLLGE